MFRFNEPKILDGVIRQIDSLPPEQRHVLGKPRSGEEIEAAMPNIPQVQRAIGMRLEEATLWQLTEDGRLVVGDGCADPAPATMDKGYWTSKQNATAAAVFQPDRGQVRIFTLPYPSAPFVVQKDSFTVGTGTYMQLVDRATDTLLWVSRLATPHEYMLANGEGRFDVNTGRYENEGPKAWLLGDPDAEFAPVGWYKPNTGKTHITQFCAAAREPMAGARRVVEVYLYGLK